jgi:hypothetical protein
LLLSNGEVYSVVAVLKIATRANCALFTMSGSRDPCRVAKLGVLRPGAWGDVLLIDRNPGPGNRSPERLREETRRLVKNGVVHKNVPR